MAGERLKFDKMEGYLLTEEERDAVEQATSSITEHTGNLLRAQLAKVLPIKDKECQDRVDREVKYREQFIDDTNAIKDRECQDRVERILREIEDHPLVMFELENRPWWQAQWWQALKQGEIK